MKFTVDARVFDRFPDTVIGVILARSINNKIDLPVINAVLRDAEKSAVQRFEGRELSEDATIHSWRKAYKLFKAGDYRCSVENLIRRVRKGSQIPTINPLVDLYNAISLEYTLPVGGEDVTYITGDLSLSFATGAEQFIPLGSTENDPPESDEIIYKDEATVLCRKWNWRESDITKLTPETKQAIFFIEGLIPEEEPRILVASKKYQQYIEDYCGATTMFHLIDKDNASCYVSD